MSSKAPGGALPSDQVIRVFLSYRRSDDRNFVGRFHDRLVARYGQDNVFMDIDSIHAGLNFSTVIAEQVSMVDAVIVMIGPTWAARLHNEGDLVRMEVVESIEAACAVVPVLIEDTPMPATESLPHDLQTLLALNIIRVRGGVDFHRDTTRALEGLEAGVAIARRAKAVRSEAEERRKHEEAELARKAERQGDKPSAGGTKSRRGLVIGVAAALIAATTTYAAWPDSAKDATSTTTLAVSTPSETTSTSTPQASTTAQGSEPLLVLLQAYPKFYQLVLDDNDAVKLLSSTKQFVTVFAPSDDAMHDLDVALASAELAPVETTTTAVGAVELTYIQQVTIAFVRHHISLLRDVNQDSDYVALDDNPIVLAPNAEGGKTIDSVATLGAELPASNGVLIELDAPLWSPSLGTRPDVLAKTTVAPGTTTTSTGTSPVSTTRNTITSTIAPVTIPETTAPVGEFAFTKISPSSAALSAQTEITITVTVSWTNAPPGGEYLCIGRSESNVPRDVDGYALAYMAQSGNCSTVGGTNGSGTLTLLIGGNFAGTATYRVFDAEGRAVGSKTFTITVV